MIIKFGKIFSLLLIFFIIVGNSFPQEKRGIIIAISKYKDENWREIHSHNDVDLIKNILLSQGFKENNILILKDSAATKRNILKSFDYLLSESKVGDILVIHFSGHGQRIFDDNDDENDFADEALVTYDAYQKWSEFYKGENHLRDDEISEYLNKFRSKIGQSGNVILFIDACYSGSITRSSEFYRGIDDIFGPPDFKEKINRIISNPSEPTGIFKSCKTAEEEEGNLLANLVVFTSSRNNERSKEITDGEKFYGSLSYGLSLAFSEIKGDETYRMIYDRVYSFMKFKARLEQVPLVEGDVDNIVFANNLLPTESYFKIIERNIYGELVVNGGRITGLNDSTVLGIYSESFRYPEPNEQITTGIIYNAGNFKSLIKIEALDKLSINDLGKYRLFILKEGVAIKKLLVAFDNVEENFKKQILNELNNLKYFEENSVTPDYILTNFNHNKIEINDSVFLFKNGNNLKFIKSFSVSSAETPEKIKSILKYLYKRDMLIGFEMQSEYYNVEIKIHNLSAGEINSSLFQEGNQFDTIKIIIKNIGERSGYLTLINIQPDDSIKQYIPKQNENISQYFLEPGAVVEKKFRNSKLGEDIYKVFITKDYIDFNFIIDSKAGRRAADLTELEVLFDDIDKGFKPRANLNVAGTTKQILINVKEKK